jgi:hypothetical protein
VACLICLPAKRKCHRPSELKPLAEQLNAGPLRTSFANHRQSASAAIGGACSSGTAVGAKGCSAGQRVAGWSCRRGEDDCPLLVVAAGSAGQGEVGWAVADVLERFGCVRCGGCRLRRWNLAVRPSTAQRSTRLRRRRRARRCPGGSGGPPTGTLWGRDLSSYFFRGSRWNAEHLRLAGLFVR